MLAKLALAIAACLACLLGLASAAANDAIAGGAGYTPYFDWRRSDVISLLWDDMPIGGFTFECWSRVVDAHITTMQVLAYSAYNVNGKFGLTPGTPYEQANEITLTYTSSLIRFFRATDRFDCTSSECTLYEREWIHQAVSFNSTTGEFGFYKNGACLDLGYTELRVDGDDDTLVGHSVVWTSEFDLSGHTTTTSYDVFTPTDPCESGDFAGGAAGKVAVLLRSSGSCTDEVRYTNAVDDGASAVLFITTSALQESDPFDTSVEPSTVVPTALATDLATPTTSVVFYRSKLSKMFGDMAQSPEPGGVLTLSAEPDAPWSSFDEYQAADALVDELRVWEVIRTPEEIEASYSIGVDKTDPDLHLYWNFDTENDATDLTANGQDGLVGELPTIENQMEWQTDRPKGAPTTPVWYPSKAPLVSSESPVVVQVLPGETVTVELGSYDVDGDDLTTVIASDPASGTLKSFEDGTTVLTSGGTSAVTDTARTASKRVYYEADAGFTTATSFTYTVADSGGTPVTATVIVEPFSFVAPANFTLEIDEDEMAYSVIGQPGNDNEMYDVVIEDLPARGTLYQALFQDGSQTYLSVILDPEDDGHVAITESGTVVDNYRGMIFYLPAADEFSEDGEVYTTFSFYYRDVATNQTSDRAHVNVYVAAVNDAPQPDTTITLTTTSAGGSVVLTSTDVDDDAPAHFAEKPFMKIIDYPSLGELYQTDDDATWLDSTVERVPLIYAYVSNIHRYSSHYSLCANCFAFKNPLCEYDLGTCSDTAWMSEAMIGEPDVYPSYVDSKLGMDFASEDYGDEWLEIQFPYEVHISGIELYEVHKPGATVKIAATPEYVDDTSVYCDDTGVENDEPVPCSMDSEWVTLWQTQERVASSLKEEARIFSPPLCPATFATDTVRLFMDTSLEGAPGWSNTDAVLLQGSAEFPPGLISADDNSVAYVPTPGVHGDDIDSFAFSASDCLDESSDLGTVMISVSEPDEDFDTPFLVQVETAEAGSAATFTLDLADAAAVVADASTVEIAVHAAKPSSMVYSTTATGSDSITFSVTPSGSAYTNAIEVWVTLDSSVTVRSHLVMCRTGYTYLEATEECTPCALAEADSASLSATDSVRFFASCSLGDSFVEFDSSAGVLAVPTAFAVIALLLTLACGAYTVLHRGSKVMRFAQVKFLFVILLGCLFGCLCALLYAMEKTDAVCQAQTWLGHLAFALIMGALFAKTWRVHRLMNNPSLKKVVIKDQQLFGMVGIVALVTMLLLLVQTAASPLKATWVVSDKTETIDFVDHKVMYLWCQSGDDADSPDRTFGTLMLILEAAFLLVGCYLAFVTRNTGDAVNESKMIAMAIYNLMFMGLIISALTFALELDPDVSALLQGVGVSFGTIVTVSVLFLPKIYAIKYKVNLDIYATTSTAGNATMATSRNSAPTTTAVNAPDAGELKISLDMERNKVKDLSVKILALEKELAEAKAAQPAVAQ